jgi:hypothetical protein
VPLQQPVCDPIFDEAELANRLLRMCPDSWQNQYNLNQDTIPQDSRRLLIVLENIEKLGVTTTVPQKPPANGNGNAKSSCKESNGKRKSTDSSTGQYNKKKRMDKHCVLCQKYGGKPATHNTGDCTKYEKDGTAVSTSPTRLKRGRMVIPTRSLKIVSSRKWTRSLRKLSSPLRARRSVATAVIAIPTPNRELGGVVRRT